MASPPKMPSVPDKPPPPPGHALRVLIWTTLIVGSFMLISLPTVMLAFFGLLPTIVAWIVDRSEQKYAMFCVLGMNLAGLFPFLLDIWFNNHSIDAVTRILSNAFDLAVIYSAAGFGWMLYIALPPVVTTFLTVMSERRVTVLKENQRTIIEEWGDGVISVVETLDANPVKFRR